MRRALAALALAALVAALAGCAGLGGGDDVSVIPGDERTPAPAFRVAALDGAGEVALADYAGTPVVLNFWASWCEPCSREAPVLEEIAQRYRVSPQEVVVLGVDVQDLREEALEFARENGVTFASLRDGEDDVKNAYQVPALPETFVIDQDGRIALKVAGQLTDPAQLTTAIEQLRTSG
jgi:cytochrome c biogenesis protein CcmG/thiol:disulfide interchange protein DsbE